MSVPIATSERRIVKLWRERAPYSWGWGRSMVWCLKWNDGTEEYTADSASGRGMFSRRRELEMRRELLSAKLQSELAKLEEKRRRIGSPLRIFGSLEAP